MSIKKELSPVMKAAVDFARCHEGKLTRHPGGFWMGPKFERGKKSFGTSTVDGLVKRGAARYSAWKDGRSGRFPVEVTLTNADQD